MKARRSNASIDVINGLDDQLTIRFDGLQALYTDRDLERAAEKREEQRRQNVADHPVSQVIRTTIAAIDGPKIEKGKRRRYVGLGERKAKPEQKPAKKNRHKDQQGKKKQGNRQAA